MANRDLERRVKELEAEVSKNKTLKSLERRVKELENKVEGHRRDSLEKRVEELERKLDRIDRL